MSETKFTPGPWTVRDHGKDRNSENNVYVHVGGEKNYGNPLSKVVMGGLGALNSDNESLIANAKLIAAAPDIFTELKDNHDFLLQLYRAINTYGTTINVDDIQQSLRDRMAKQLDLINKVII